MLLDTAPQFALELEKLKTCCSCQPATKPARALRYRPRSSKLFLVPRVAFQGGLRALLVNYMPLLHERPEVGKVVQSILAFVTVLVAGRRGSCPCP